MKTTVLVFCILLTASCSLAGAPLRYRMPIEKARPPLHKVVTWKEVAAGGAAAGTVIAAYKISDGVEDGIRISAEKDPAGFTGFLDRCVRPFRWILYLVSGGAVLFLYFKLKRK